MSRTARNRSNERTGAGANNAANTSSPAGARSGNNARNAGGSHRGPGGSVNNANSPNNNTNLVDVTPETPAEMVERLRGERTFVLNEILGQAEDYAVAEEIGFSLAKEIGERACDLYIKTTYDEYANEYTALAVWDEMMDAIGSFSQAVPAQLPSNSAFGVEFHVDPATNLATSFTTGARDADEINTKLFRKLPSAPGIRMDPDTPPAKNLEGAPPGGVGSGGLLRTVDGKFVIGAAAAAAAGVERKLGLPPALSQQPTTSALKASSLASASSPDAGAGAGEPKKEKRRVRLTVTEPDAADDKSHETSGSLASKDDSSSGALPAPKKLSAREQLQLAVEEKQKEEIKKRELDLQRSPLHAQVVLAQLRLDMEPPLEEDPSWIPDAPPPTMFCDLTARHAAGLKLKTVDTAQLLSSLGINVDAASAANPLNASTMAGASGLSSTLNATARGGRGQTQILGGTMRKSMISGTRPPSGTVTSNSGRSNSGNGGPARPLSPTSLTLNEVSKDSIPIHILTHHLSMMASKSPYQPKKDNSKASLSTSDKNYRILGEEGAPPDNDSYAGGPPTGRGNTGNNNSKGGGDSPTNRSEDDPFAPPPHIAIPDADDRESSAFSSLEEDDDSHQSPSEIEVAQRLQLRQAQKTRNTTAFNTITNQLNELTNSKQQPNTSSSSPAASGTTGNNSNTATNNNNNNASNSTTANNIISLGAGNLGDKNLVVDARLGRVIPISTVGDGPGVSGGGGGKKGSRNINPLIEAPKFNVQMPAPPSVEPPANSREARLARRAATISSSGNNNNSRSAPTSSAASPLPADSSNDNNKKPSTAATTSPTAATSSPTRQPRGSSSYSTPQKKKKRRGNDPTNFFEPEAKVSPMIQMFNPSGGVIVKDDNGSRRNERPNQPSRLSREDYKKILRLGPAANNNNNPNGVGGFLGNNNNNNGNSADFAWNPSNMQQQQQQSQTARGANNNNNSNNANAKTARR